jgi:hypothetical protein
VPEKCALVKQTHQLSECGVSLKRDFQWPAGGWIKLLPNITAALLHVAVAVAMAACRFSHVALVAY